MYMSSWTFFSFTATITHLMDTNKSGMTIRLSQKMLPSSSWTLIQKDSSDLNDSGYPEN